MPTLKLIDGNAALGDYDVRTFVVPNRNEAARILRYDLQATADPAWSADILIEFAAGGNRIQRDNGLNAWFRVVYSAATNIPNPKALLHVHVPE